MVYPGVNSFLAGFLFLAGSSVQWLEGDSLFAESINGLYVLDARYLDQLTDRITNVSNKQALPDYVVPLVLGLTLFAGALAFLLYRSRRRLNRIMEESQVTTPAPPKVTRGDIETFIQENLAQASLKSIAEKFQTNNAVIYSLLSPEKPGALINRLRMERVHRLRKFGRSAREISQQTGFSEFYVRKVWNKNEESDWKK